MNTDEPEITIGGEVISPAKAMTIRVALSDFMFTLAKDGMGDDEIGKAVCANYIQNTVGIQRLMR